MSNRVVVTGATGNIGSRVAWRLAGAGIEPTLLVRDPARAPQIPNADVRAFTGFTDAEAISAAIEPGDTVLMVSGAETPDRVDQHKAFIDAVVESAAGQLVYTSFFGAAAEATFTLARDHWATEQHIWASGIPFTFLRDNLYADFLPMMAGEDGVIRGPAGGGRAAMVAQDDVADVATVVLRHPDAHAGETYNLTGPQSLTLAEAAGVVSEVTGRTVSFYDEAVDEAYRSREVYAAPDWQLDAWVSTYLAIAKGELDGVSDDVERITGHPATSLADLLKR